MSRITESPVPLNGEMAHVPPNIADILQSDGYFRIKKSRKSKKESLVLSTDAKADLETQFGGLVDFFNGDLGLVKDHANNFGKKQKSLYDQKLISEAEYKKSLLVTSSIRGKATYKAYQNYVYTKNSEKISNKTKGLRGIFYSKKAISKDSDHLKDSIQNPVSVMKEWKKLKKEDREKSSQDVWVSSRKYEKTRTELENYWGNKSAVLDQDSQRLLTEAGIDPKTLKKAKGKLNKSSSSWRKQLVLTALGVGILIGGVNTVQAKIKSGIQSEVIAAASAQFFEEWDLSTPEPDPTVIATNTEVVSVVENTSTPEKIEKMETLELLRQYYADVVLPGRINHLDSLSKEERLKVFESIGGPENIDNGLFTTAVLGKDTTGDRFGVDKDGNPLGRNDQSVVVLIDINNNQINVVSIPRTVAIPAGMYGASTPDNINGLTWIDQAHPTQDGGYVPLDREIAQRVITDATGYYLDGMVEFDFESASTLVDSLFPEGVKIEMTDSFVPENDILGRISGWKKGGYEAFVEGETYKFNGEALVALLRARETRKEGTFQRESDASRVIAQLMKQVVTEFLKVESPQELASRIESVQTLAKSTEQLESSGNLRAHFWGENKKPTEILLNVLSKIGLDDMWDTASSYQMYGEDISPDVDYYSPSVDEMVSAPGREHYNFFQSGIDQNDPYKHQRNPVKFWQSLREKVKSMVNN